MSVETIKAQLKKGYAPEFLIECNFDGDYDRIAQRDISFPDRHFKGLLLNDITISSTLNFDRFQYSISTATIRRNNADRFQDQELTRRLDGAICNIYLYVRGLSWSDISTDGLIFKGIFEKDYHTEKEYVFKITDFSKTNKKSLVPKVTINDDTWPLHRKAGGAGSVSGNPVPLVFGDFPGGVKLQCVDYSSDYLYVAMHGISKSVDADYTATTENVYDESGVVINAGNYELQHTVDGTGNPATIIDMTGNYAASEPLSCSIQGASDGSGEYTGTAGTLIEHPADIIAYLYDNFGQTGSQMNSETLKSMKVKYSGIKYATAITSQEDLDSIGRRILYPLQCATISRIGGDHGIMIFDTNRSPSGRLVQDFSQVGHSSNFKKTPERLLCNNLTVNYYYNHATGQYEGEITRDKENNEDCLQSYMQYGYEYEKTLELQDVYDESTAELIANKYIETFAFRHDILERPAVYHDAYGMQEGDVIKITDADGPGGWVGEECILIEKKYTKNYINQTFWRIDI